jgi:hypothetical protein
VWHATFNPGVLRSEIKEMRAFRFYIVVIFLIICATAQSQIVRRGNTNWVGLNLDEVYRLNGYEITQHTCSNDQGSLCVFIKRAFDKEPIQFYAHHREVLVTVGHRKQIVLINDWFATKSGRVVVANLNSGVKTEIDRQALSMYRRHAKPDPRLWIVPEAYEFSPDDKQVLIKMVKEDVSAATASESAIASRSYKDWWYSIDAKNGRVLYEFRANHVASRWWRYRRA